MITFCVARHWAFPQTFHWRRTIKTWSLPSLFNELGHSHTAHDLYLYFMTLPVIRPKRRRSAQSHRIRSQLRREEFDKVRKEAIDYLVANNIPVPSSLEEQRSLMTHIGKYLAATVFLTTNPDWLLSLPVNPEADDRDQLLWRTTFDERLTFPIDALPMEVQQFFLTSKPDQSSPPARSTEEPPKKRVTLGMPETAASGADRRWAIGLQFYRCPGKVWVDQKKDWMECGLVLSALSQWTYTHHSKNRKGGRHRWACKHCECVWKRQTTGTRLVTIYDGIVCLQLILDEPPQPEWNDWAKDRIEFYQRLEPNDSTRDVAPDLPCVPASHRIRCTGSVSHQVWKVLYTNPDPHALLQLDMLAAKARELSSV